MPLRLSISMAKAAPRGPGLWSLDDARGRGAVWGERAKSRWSLAPGAARSPAVLHPHKYRPSFSSLTCHARVQCPCDKALSFACSTDPNWIKRTLWFLSGRGEGSEDEEWSRVNVLRNSSSDSPCFFREGGTTCRPPQVVAARI